MTKTTCDICGKEMPTTSDIKFPNSAYTMNFCISSHGRIWDICDECREYLNRCMTKRTTVLGENGGD